jgi:hypothetical protein
LNLDCRCNDIDTTFTSSECSDNAESSVNGASKRKDSSEVSEVLDEMEKVNTKEETSVGLAVSDSTMAALQQEVEQLTTALATQSKVVCDGHIFLHHFGICPSMFM